MESYDNVVGPFAVRFRRLLAGVGHGLDLGIGGGFSAFWRFSTRLTGWLPPNSPSRVQGIIAFLLSFYSFHRRYAAA